MAGIEKTLKAWKWLPEEFEKEDGLSIRNTPDHKYSELLYQILTTSSKEVQEEIHNYPKQTQDFIQYLESFLQQQTTVFSSTLETTRDLKDFPTLQPSKPQHQPKRRIRTTLLQTTPAPNPIFHATTSDPTTDIRHTLQPTKPFPPLEHSTASMTPAPVVLAPAASASTSTLDPSLKQIFLQLKQLYIWLIRNKYTPNILLQLQVITRLLYISRKSTTTADLCPPIKPYWHWFALEALHDLQSILQHCGRSFLNTLASSIDDQDDDAHGIVLRMLQTHANDSTVDDLDHSLLLQHHKIGDAMALPFDQATESRHLFKSSPTLLAIYSNREKTRDGFLFLVRFYNSNLVHHFGTKQQLNHIETYETQRQGLLKNLVDANYDWFSEFFVNELMQIGLCPLGETDLEVSSELGQHKEKQMLKLDKLHKRFYAKQTSSKQPKNPKKPQGSCIHETHAWSCFHGTSQEFFYRFLRDCDSYRLNYFVLRMLKFKLISILENYMTSEARDDENLKTSSQSFVVDALRLKVLAKFIAYLEFSPNTAVFRLKDLGPDAKSSPFAVAQEKALDRMEKLQVDFNILKYLQQSIEEKQLLLCIPWICDFLRLAEHDMLANQTSVFQEAWQLLIKLHRSVLSPETKVGFLILVQIEQLFYEVQKEGLVTAQVQGMSKIIEYKDRAQLECVESVYRQYCCTALEDLKTAIQKIASESAAASLTTSSSHLQSTVRKMRPSTVEESFIQRDTQQAQLRQAFMRRHSNIKNVTQSVSDQILKNGIESVKKNQQLVKEIREMKIGDAASLRQITTQRCEAALATCCRQNLTVALELLLKDSLQKAVLQLVIEYAYQSIQVQFIGRIKRQILPFFLEQLGNCISGGKVDDREEKDCSSYQDQVAELGRIADRVVVASGKRNLLSLGGEMKNIVELLGLFPSSPVIPAVVNRVEVLVPCFLLPPYSPGDAKLAFSKMDSYLVLLIDFLQAVKHRIGDLMDWTAIERQLLSSYLSTVADKKASIILYPENQMELMWVKFLSSCDAHGLLKPQMLEHSLLSLLSQTMNSKESAYLWRIITEFDPEWSKLPRVRDFQACHLD